MGFRLVAARSVALARIACTGALLAVGCSSVLPGGDSSENGGTPGASDCADRFYGTSWAGTSELIDGDVRDYSSLSIDANGAFSGVVTAASGDVLDWGGVSLTRDCKLAGAVWVNHYRPVHMDQVSFALDGALSGCSVDAAGRRACYDAVEATGDAVTGCAVAIDGMTECFHLTFH